MKVFTIAEGLENLGALRTGGQGSVYKTRRTGTIITAVKMIPTPVNAENERDPNYRNFLNEVNKLTKVNEEPNPNVVKMLSWGVTESGSFPFIEMEYIEGPDLAELLNPPHERIFTIKEVTKVADQLACALSHCHRAGVRHGDIKSNNVKFNTSSGNYVLLDFGLAVMSDEQRRTSLRHAGAVEFMAPEQSEGQMLFQTDVYSFGIVLYELLAGQVPFPLNEQGEMTRNKVMLQHVEAKVPDLLELRKANLPVAWPSDKREREMQVPKWLISLIYKCLEKKPENRFADGMVLHDTIAEQSLSGGTNAELQAENTVLRNKITEIAQVDDPAPIIASLAGDKDILRDAVRKRALQKYRIWTIVLVIALAGMATGFLFANAAYEKKQRVINDLRDSISMVKDKEARDSITYHKLIKKLQTTLRTQSAITQSLRQDSVERARRLNWLYGEPQNDQQQNQQDQQKKRRRLFGIF